MPLPLSPAPLPSHRRCPSATAWRTQSLWRTKTSAGRCALGWQRVAEGLGGVAQGRGNACTRPSLAHTPLLCAVRWDSEGGRSASFVVLHSSPMHPPRPPPPRSFSRQSDDDWDSGSDLGGAYMGPGDQVIDMLSDSDAEFSGSEGGLVPAGPPEPPRSRRARVHCFAAWLPREVAHTLTPVTCPLLRSDGDLDLDLLSSESGTTSDSESSSDEDSGGDAGARGARRRDGGGGGGGRRRGPPPPSDDDDDSSSSGGTGGLQGRAVRRRRRRRSGGGSDDTTTSSEGALQLLGPGWGPLGSDATCCKCVQLALAYCQPTASSSCSPCCRRVKRMRGCRLCAAAQLVGASGFVTRCSRL